jgi:hypothetical protein
MEVRWDRAVLVGSDIVYLDAVVDGARDVR